MIPNPGKIIGTMVYVEGNEHLGEVEVTCPDIMFLTEEVNSLGGNGPRDMALPKLEKM